MKSKPIIPRALANRDVDAAIEHYLNENAELAALGFIEALEQAYTHIGRHPVTGSPRYAHELDLPGLRSWPLTRYPYLAFYIERDHQIDVWRVLHGQRDIPGWLVQTLEWTAPIDSNGVCSDAPYLEPSSTVR